MHGKNNFAEASKNLDI